MSEENKKQNFIQRFLSLMEEYDIVDFAFVGKKLTGEANAFWEAVTEEDPMSNYERTGLLHYELSKLALTMVARAIPKNSNSRI